MQCTPNTRTSHLSLMVLLAVSPLASSASHADDWLSWPSSYTHEPTHGQRVDQYAHAAQPIAPQRQDFLRSGYRHFRSTLQAGQSADNIHIVEQWGRQVVPYEQWRFPYRPYAVPYDAWGPQAPYGIINGSFGYGGYGYDYGATGNGGALGARPGMPGRGAPAGPGAESFPYHSPRGFPLTPPYNNEPWYDGTYPSAPPLGRQ